MDERADGDDLSAEYGRRRREDDDAAAERRDVEWAATPWHSLVVGSCGHEVELTLTTGSVVAGEVTDVGGSWCLVATGGSAVAVILEHVTSMRAPLRTTPPGRIQRPLGSVLRRWARMRGDVSLELADGTVCRGKVRHVLSDAVLVASDHDPVGRVIPLTALISVRGPRLDPAD